VQSESNVVTAAKRNPAEGKAIMANDDTDGAQAGRRASRAPFSGGGSRRARGTRKTHRDCVHDRKESPIDTVTSSDGTPIAFDRLGDGPPVIVVGGQLCDRAMTRPTAEELAKHFTVFNYDRRGRGDSGDTAPYAVEREIEDLGALIAEATGTASVYAHSSGAGLALHAAAHALPIAKLVLHEPPYNPDGEEEERRISREYAENLEAILAEDRLGDAVELCMTTIGMPQEAVEGMRHTPRWAELEAMAPTLAYDSEIMGDSSTGGTVPTDLAGCVTSESLVLVGGASPAWMIDVGRQVADALPNGRYRVLDGQEHVVAPEVLVPVLAEFFAG
jgi:pimeloyl-ACP methyl ester carboxylesterase